MVTLVHSVLALKGAVSAHDEARLTLLTVEAYQRKCPGAPSPSENYRADALNIAHFLNEHLPKETLALLKSALDVPAGNDATGNATPQAIIEGPEQQLSVGHVPKSFVVLPSVMTAAMINAWTGGKSMTSDIGAACTAFQDAWKRVRAAAPSHPLTFNPVPEGFVVLPSVMTAAMINAWSGGKSMTSDIVAARTTFQDAWKRVLAAAPSQHQFQA